MGSKISFQGLSIAQNSLRPTCFFVIEFAENERPDILVFPEGWLHYEIVEVSETIEPLKYVFKENKS